MCAEKFFFLELDELLRRSERREEIHDNYIFRKKFNVAYSEKYIANSVKRHSLFINATPIFVVAN